MTARYAQVERGGITAAEPPLPCLMSNEAVAQPYVKTVAATLHRRLPARYDQPYRTTFDDRVRSALRPDLRILDVGAGRHPTIPAANRPPGCSYVGLDVSGSELTEAGAGAYDETVVRDVAERDPSLAERFDLIVSWQVLEHVRPLDVAIDNLQLYLRPGGRLVAQFSGGWSAFAVANTLLPQRARMWVLTRLVGKHPDQVFPAFYDRCHYGALQRMLASWSSHEVVPLYVGAVPYFGFSRLVRTAYMAYEEWTYRQDIRNLASYYVVDAVR